MQNTVRTKIFQYLRQLIVLIFIGINSTLGAQGGMGPAKAISGGLSRLLEGLTSINIESTTLGIDKGIIAGAILGIGRKVERNPFPTSVNDQYLVKDRMRLGYELGAGFVVGGVVSYVQEWTLVYPVPTSLKGTLSRKFLLDLFLPLTVKKIQESTLPQDYALIRESYFEGKGRLKAGGITTLGIGNQFTYGKVFLNGLVTRKYKNGDLKVMREYSRFSRFFHELWMNLVLFDLPVFDAYKEKGKVVRNYITLKNQEITPALKDKLFHALFTGLNEDQLNKLFENETVNRRVESEFKENYAGLNFFGLFNKETFHREDYITDTHYQRDDSGLQITKTQENWYQYHDRHYHDWTTGVESEVYRSDVSLSGKTIKSRGGKVSNIENPQLTLKLIVRDDQTTQREYQDIYLPMFESLRPRTMEYLPKNILELQSAPEAIFTLEARLNSSLLDKLRNTKINDWYMALEQVTGRPKVYWKRAAENGYQNRDRQRLRQARLPLREIHLAKKLRTIERYLNKARKLKSKDPVVSLRYVVWTLRKMFGVGKGAWDIRLLEILRKVIGEDFLVGANLTIFESGNEEKMDFITTYQVRNEQIEKSDQVKYNFLLVDPSEIFFFFEKIPDL